MTAIRTVSPRRIYEARLRAGLTQEDVVFALRARGLRTTAKSVRRWESDHGNTPRADILPALADAFGVSLDHLYATEEAKAEVEVDMDAALAIGVAVVKAMQQMQPAAAR